MITVLLPFQTRALDGNGSAEQPFALYSRSDLDSIRNHKQSYFILMNDVYIKETHEDTLAGKWAPIGSPGDPFTGELNGNGHMLINLDAQFFGYINSGTVRNLGIKNFLITDSLSRVGIIVGDNNGGLIDSCSISGKFEAKGWCIGGIVGFNIGGTISNCRSVCEINASGDYIGGVAGWNAGGNGIIRNCYTYGKVFTVDKAYAKAIGGIAGDNSSGCEIINCFSA